MRFEDHFSRQARAYARYRPSYPPALFQYLASIAPHHRLAWDCGTGSGQAARDLTAYFQRVIATDASRDQLAHALPHPQIEYRAEPVEAASLEPGSVALTTVAVAIHWFDLESFYEVVRRVSTPGGILAAWTYHLPAIEPEIDRILAEYNDQVLAGYWPERIHYLQDKYRTLPFPFAELDPPPLEAEAVWDLKQVIGFLKSWSGTRRYREARGENPIRAIWPELSAAWGPPCRKRTIRWPLHLRVGRVR